MQIQKKRCYLGYGGGGGGGGIQKVRTIRGAGFAPKAYTLDKNYHIPYTKVIDGP